MVIADDHEATLVFYRDLLSQHGCHVTGARTGAEAVAQVRAMRPDVAVLDIQMPEQDGLTAIRQIRADPGVGATPIIARTTLAMPGDREACLTAGANVYVNHPHLKEGALLWRDRRTCLRAVRHVYGCPAGNSPGSDHICVASEPAACADKRGLGLAVRLGDTPARRTGTRRIPRVNEMDVHPRQRRLVDNKGAELKEGPALERGALRPANGSSRADSLEVFQGNRPRCAFGLRHDLRAEGVVDLRCEPAFLSGQLAQSPPTAPRAFPLELVPQTPMSVANVLDGLAAVDLPIAIHGDIRHPKVYAQHAGWNLWCGRLHRTGGTHIPLPITVGKVALALLGGQQAPLTCAAHEGDGLPPVKRPDGNRRRGNVKREDAAIKRHRPHGGEGAQRLFVPLVGVGHLGNAAHGQLGRHAEIGANAIVHQRVQRELAKRCLSARRASLESRRTRCTS